MAAPVSGVHDMTCKWVCSIGEGCGLSHACWCEPETLPTDPAYAHDPDRNPRWTPLFGRRVVACAQCGTEQTTTTNHTGTVWGLHCVGRCRQIINPHTAREIVLPYHGPHKYVREA